MSSSLRRGALAAAATAISLASLSACAAGNDAATLEVKPDNAATSVGDIKIQNANVITQPEGTPGEAVVTAQIFNNGRDAQTLDSVTIKGAGTVKLAPAKGSGKVTIPAGGSLLLGGQGNASAVIPNGSTSAKDGNAERIVFGFSKTGDIPITAFVVPAKSYFAGYGPTAAPSPSGSASASASPSGSATPSGGASKPAQARKAGH